MLILILNRIFSLTRYLQKMLKVTRIYRVLLSFFISEPGRHFCTELFFFAYPYNTLSFIFLSPFSLFYLFSNQVFGKKDSLKDMITAARLFKEICLFFLQILTPIHYQNDTLGQISCAVLRKRVPVGQFCCELGLSIYKIRFP